MWKIVFTTFFLPYFVEEILNLPTFYQIGDCKITSCKNGGNLGFCWSLIKNEYNFEKENGCNEVELVSGDSAYAMSLSLPVCVRKETTIGVHVPFSIFKDNKQVKKGDFSYDFYFGKLPKIVVKNFKNKNGFLKSDNDNAKTLIYTKGKENGKPYCKFKK